MSCNTPDESVYTNRSFSPSEESRFVPRQSISIMEGHFTSTPPPKPPTMNCDAPNLVADDEKSGIVGATICFTPQPSPPGTPGAAPLMNSVETEEYIGSIDAGKDKSSLDDGADFELLDGVESNGSIKVEDLDVDEDVVGDVLKDTPKTMKDGVASDNPALKELIVSPPSSVPSLTNDEVAVAGDDDKKLPVGPVMNEDSLLYSDDATSLSRMTKSMLSHMAKLGKQDTASVEDEVSDAPSSPKVDATPISTLKTLKTFWENRVLGKTTEEAHDTNIDCNSSNEDHQSISNSIVSFDRPKPSLISSIGLAIWLWIQSLALLCAFSIKKFMEQICNALARNIISTAAGRTDGTVAEAEDKDDIDLEEIVGSTRRNLGSLFSDSGMPSDTKVDPTSEAGSIDDASNSQANQTTDWKSRVAQVIAFILLVLHLLYSLLGPSSTSGFEEDEFCLTTNTTSFDSVPVWEIDLDATDATHIQLYASSSIPMLSFLASVIVALVCTYIYKPDFIKKLSIKKESKHLTGLWTAKEHEDFIKGFEQYGSNWKMVAPFIPTRTYEQVKTHGIHWKKIGSPDSMKRSKKIKIEACITPIATASDALTQLTPKVSNIADAITKKEPSKEKQLARAREYAQTLKKAQSAKTESKSKSKGSSGNSS